MQGLKSYWLYAGAVLVVAQVAGTHASAAVVYSDPLTGSGGALNGTTVDVSASVAGGTSGATWNASTLLTQDATGATRPTGTAKAHAWLPFVAQSGYTYTLQATLNPIANSWAALGFSVSASAPGTGNNFQDNSTIAWGLVRQPGAGNPQFFRGGGTFDNSGPGGTSSVNFATAAQSGLQTMTIVLDTTASTWTATATVAGYGSTVKTYASGEPVKWVGFGSDQGAAAFSNFSLTAVAVPEPGALGVVLLGGCGLLRRRRLA